MKSGFICIAGLANAGKSTLINALVGEKVSIVSWRPQTTRNKILGILNGDDYQIVLIDTPGIHKAKNQLGEFMMQSVSSGLKDVEGVIYVIDASRGMQKEDYEFIEKYAEVKPLIVVLNKEDAVTRETMFFSLDKLNKLNGIKAIIPMSAKKGGNLEPLMNEILSLMPEGAAMFPDDMYTDSTMRFMASEIIREKALYLLDKEVPYGIGVFINKFEMREDKAIYDIDADIVCEKQSHKAIIIGKQGDMLKKIATAARLDLEELTGEHVFLTLYVRVKTEWRDSEYLMRELGYDLKAIKKDN
ncbi:MAG: GTPase Era [Clostridia bacterium]